MTRRDDQQSRYYLTEKGEAALGGRAEVTVSPAAVTLVEHEKHRGSSNGGTCILTGRPDPADHCLAYTQAAEIIRLTSELEQQHAEARLASAGLRRLLAGVASAWLDKGRAPRVHEQAQEQLLRDWPVLARAVAAVAAADGKLRFREPVDPDWTAEETGDPDVEGQYR